MTNLTVYEGRYPVGAVIRTPEGMYLAKRLTLDTPPDESVQAEFADQGAAMDWLVSVHRIINQN